MNLNANIYIGPMSKNIVDCIINYCNNNNKSINFIPSRRQIEFDGGYVNNWTTQEFSSYVKNKTNKCLIQRDHSGPGQGNSDYLESLKYDCQYFDIIHIDPWKQFQNYNDGLNETIKLINYCYNLNNKILFEISTEEAIRKFTVDELEQLIIDLQNNLDYQIFNNIKYLVIQSGTALKGTKNIGNFDQNRLKNMINLANKYNFISKEHNGDFLTNYEINIRFQNGLNAINIAPEFGHIKTKVILNEIKNDQHKLNKLYNLCYQSNKWKKWIDKVDSKEELIIVSGHYLFSDPEFINIKNTIPNIDNKIIYAINNKLNKLHFLL